MSSASEFDINVKLLNEALVKLKSYYHNPIKQSLSNKRTLDAIVELHALAIYVDKGSTNQPDIPPKENEFDLQVWKALKVIEKEAIATDIAQNQFNKLFQIHQQDILTLAHIHP